MEMSNLLANSNPKESLEESETNVDKIEPGIKIQQNTNHENVDLETDPTLVESHSELAFHPQANFTQVQVHHLGSDEFNDDKDALDKIDTPLLATNQVIII